MAQHEGEPNIVVLPVVQEQAEVGLYPPVRLKDVRHAELASRRGGAGTPHATSRLDVTEPTARARGALCAGGGRERVG